MESLLCIDLSNLIVRHHANPYGQAVDVYGRRVQGAVGALAQVLRSLERHQPTHLLLARDCKREESFRRELYPGYKANRKESDPELALQFELAWKGAEVLGLPSLGEPGHEADDVIASACERFPGRCYVLTGDRDLLALCSERVKVLLLRSGGEQLVDPAGVRQLLGVSPDQIRDYKALVGDASDAIPGVEGVGAKSATKLLARFPSLAAIYRHLEAGGEIDVVPARITKKIEAGREQARLSWQLAGLVRDIEVDTEALRAPAYPTDERVGEQLDELGLHWLRKQLSPSVGESSEELDIEEAFRIALGS